MCCKLSLAEGWRPSTTTSPFAKAKGEKSPSPLSPALSCRKSQTPIGVVHRGMVPQCCQLEQVQLEPRAIVQRKRPPPPPMQKQIPTVLPICQNSQQHQQKYVQGPYSHPCAMESAQVHHPSLQYLQLSANYHGICPQHPACCSERPGGPIFYFESLLKLHRHNILVISCSCQPIIMGPILNKLVLVVKGWQTSLIFRISSHNSSKIKSRVPTCLPNHFLGCQPQIDAKIIIGA